MTAFPLLTPELLEQMTETIDRAGAIALANSLYAAAVSQVNLTED
ncbi:hypothetical protein [Nodosilinea sp. FACHB-13]|nr:hypothetical protein [Nodosilinea sp. FACHB-13]